MRIRAILACVIVAIASQASRDQMLRQPVRGSFECPEHLTMFFEGKCFGFFDLPQLEFDAIAAQLYCENYGGDLLSIRNSEENEFIINMCSVMFGDDYDVLLGLYCVDGKLEWLDQCPVGYTNFDEALNDSPCSGDTYFKIGSNNDHWIEAEKAMTTKTIACSYIDYCEIPNSSEEPRNSTSMTLLSTTTESDSVQTNSVIIIVVIASIAAVIGISIAIICFVVWYRKRKRREEEKLKKQSVIENHRNSSLRYTKFPGGKDLTDGWEISRRLISIDFATKLGQGAFGSVYLGAIEPSHLPICGRKPLIGKSNSDTEVVAVKMLHESADKSQQLQFLEEIELMKRIGYHERLVNILACVTLSEPTMLVVEYCEHGDLLSYMREKRKFMMATGESISSIDRSKIITLQQQLMFCIQIAYGLEYLSHRGIVHRDIAARNILVDQSECCKIGDFGLCREVSRGEEHYHSRGGRLPLKWMSPEAIEHYTFSVASDVWSFGVLLFEIITIGGNPYPDWPAAEILNNLKAGMRMDRPDNCSDEMFELMISCWKLDPSERPSFSDLRIRIGRTLEEASDDEYYLKLDARANYYCPSSEIDIKKSVIKGSDSITEINHF